MPETSHGFESKFYTRKEILYYGALGLLSCTGLACGTRGHTIQGANVPSDISTPEMLQIDGGATANAPAVRGERFQIGPIPTIPKLWLPGDLVLGGDRNGPKIVAITSDDGPTRDNGIRMSNHMRDAGLEGLITYFMVANNLAVWPDEGRQVFERGYGIANHSLTHATYDPYKIAQEIQAAQDVIWSILGIYPDLFRSPGLTRGSVIQQKLAELGMANIFTTTNINDWVSPRISSSQIVANVQKTIHPGNILLIHDGGTHEQTINAMPLIIKTIRELGYEILRLEELLASGSLQIDSRIYQATSNEIFEDLQQRGEIADEFINIVAEYQTYLETTTNLSAERRAFIESKIAEAMLVASN